MRCWSCGRKISRGAKACRYCEAPVEPEPTQEEIETVQEALANMSPEALDELEAAFLSSRTGEDFVNRVMVGDCPKCGSAETSDCDGDPEIEDISVGRCFRCGLLWCLECGQLLERGQKHCSRCDDD
jgi:hypothetical protein